MVFKATYDNISGLSWQSVLFMKETGVAGEKHRPPQSRTLMELVVILMKKKYLKLYQIGHIETPVQ